jgi:hypothetical protein
MGIIREENNCGVMPMPEICTTAESEYNGMPDSNFFLWCRGRAWGLLFVDSLLLS